MDKLLWKGKPSQLINLKSFLFFILLYLGVTILMNYFFSYYVKHLNDFHVKKIVLLSAFYFKYFFAGFLVILLSISFIKIICIRYELTNERLIIYSGVLERIRDEVELYRIKDYRIIKPFILNIFGYGNIELVSSDRETQIIKLVAIKKTYELTDLIRNNVELMRKEKGVREIDYDRFF